MNDASLTASDRVAADRGGKRSAVAGKEDRAKTLTPSMASKATSETMVNIVYQSVVALAKDNLPATDMELCSKSGYQYTSVSAALAVLRNRDMIDVRRVGRGRQVTILTGEYAGLKTAANYATPPKPKPAPVKPPVQVLADTQCQWCGKIIRARRYGDRKSYCGYWCSVRHNKHGFRSQKEIEDIQNRPPGPKGCTSVEEWLERGGQITRIEPAPWPMGGMPVRPKASLFSSKVR